MEDKPAVKLPSLGPASKPALRFPNLELEDQFYQAQHTFQRRPIRPLQVRRHGTGMGLHSHTYMGSDVNFNGQRFTDSVISDSGFSEQHHATNFPHTVNDSHSFLDDEEYPAPYQTQKFKSSTIMRMVTVPRRHQDMFGSKDRFYPKKKGVAFHTNRYHYLESIANGDQYDKTSSEFSQRERLLAETAHLEKLREIRRHLELSAPHRLPLNLAMGGSRVELNDRVDIPAELRELRSIVLPSHARDLFVGRGIVLPDSHQLNRPRHLRPLV